MCAKGEMDADFKVKAGSYDSYHCMAMHRKKR